MRPLIIEPFHFQAVGRERPAAVEGDAGEHGRERNVEPDHRAVAQHQLAVAGIDHGAAPRGHDRAALRQQGYQLFALDAAEVRLALLPEN